MSTPIRIQRRRVKGWRMPPNTVSVCRPGKWGNPFVAADYHYGEGAVPEMSEWMVGLYRRWLETTPEGQLIADAARRELRGKNLACFCRIGKPCHADLLLKIANP